MIETRHLLELPVLPPLLNAIAADNPFTAALDRARDGTLNAGDFFWAPENNTARLAIALAPEISAQRCAEMLALTMAALGETIGVLTPPQVGVHYHNDLTVSVNAGTAGSVRAGLPVVTDWHEVPAWLITGVEAALHRDADDPEPGLNPDVTSLSEEGCENLDLARFLETFARHFLAMLNTWQEDGFAPVARSWQFLARDRQPPDLARLARALSQHPDAP